jgi:hypothetical protein
MDRENGNTATRIELGLIDLAKAEGKAGNTAQVVSKTGDSSIAAAQPNYVVACPKQLRRRLASLPYGCDHIPRITAILPQSPTIQVTGVILLRPGRFLLRRLQI